MFVPKQNNENGYVRRTSWFWRYQIALELVGLSLGGRENGDQASGRENGDQASGRENGDQASGGQVAA